MLFNSFAFVLFFIVVTFCYFAAPYRFRWIILLTASCYFYMTFVPVYILILGFTIIIDYFAGLEIEKAKGRKRLFFLVSSLIANIGILVVFKYYNFISANLTDVLKLAKITYPLPYLSILLPIGLSFHTFQAMSYTIEVYRGKQKPEAHFGIYALYVMFYPQLVAGPIERPQNILHQFREKHNFDDKRMVSGLRLMLWGFFKKMVIADNLALVSNNVFDHYHFFKGSGIFIGVIAFSIQIFCDFSGYSDIAIGAARVMGFNLMINFKRPYLAESIAEFWTRWHISLSTWFRDYLYIPLGGNRVSVIRWCLNIMLVFMLSGLWHGANWTFIVWGLIHGIYLIVYHLFANAREKLKLKTEKFSQKKFSKLFNIVLTFLLVSVTWVFFRSENIQQALFMINHVFSNWNIVDINQALSVWGSGRLYALVMVFFIVILIFAALYQERFGSITVLLNKQLIVVRWSVYFFLFFSIILFGVFENIKFIYFQF